MKKKLFLWSAAILMTMTMVTFIGCKEDDKEFNLSTLLVDAADMNGATAPVDVALNPTIYATFSSDVDAASATTSTIKLVNNADGTGIAISVTVASKTITVVPEDGLGTGTQYNLQFLAGVKGTNGVELTPFTRSFVTEGVYAPSGAFAYWNFNNDPNEQVAGSTPSGSVNITYADSYSAAAGQAAKFDGTTSILEFANGDVYMNTHDFSLSFWVKAESAGHVNGTGDPKGHFVIGLGAFYGFQFEIPGDYNSCKLAGRYELGDGTTASEDLWFPGDGNLSWQGWTFCKDLTASGGVAGLLKDKWANVTCVYNSATKEGIMYINGEKMKAQDFDLWPDGDAKRTVVGLKYGGVAPEVVNELAFGFIQSRAGTLWDTEPWGGYDIPTANHFGGLLDDVRIYHRVLTEDEIFAMYNSAK